MRGSGAGAGLTKPTKLSEWLRRSDSLGGRERRGVSRHPISIFLPSFAAARIPRTDFRARASFVRWGVTRVGRSCDVVASRTGNSFMDSFIRSFIRAAAADDATGQTSCPPASPVVDSSDVSFCYRHIPWVQPPNSDIPTG